MARKSDAKTTRRVPVASLVSKASNKPKPSGRQSYEAQSRNTLEAIETLPPYWREALRRHFDEKPQNRYLDIYVQTIARCEKVISYRENDTPSFAIFEPCVIAANDWIRSKNMEKLSGVKSKNHEKLAVQNAVFESMLFGKNIRGRRAQVGVQGTVTRDLDVKLVQNFLSPDSSVDQDEIRYAVDVGGFQKTVECHLPESLKRALHYDEADLILAANVSPKYTCVDIHSDGSLHVWTICDAPKLWVAWPPTEHNLKHFCATRNSAKILNQLWHKLEGGQYALTQEGEGMYMPPRWPHATYSLESSMPIGFAFSSAEALEPATRIMQQDLNIQNPGGHPDIEVLTWLQSLKLAVKVDSATGRKACFDIIKEACHREDMQREEIEILIGSAGQNHVKAITEAFGDWEDKWALTQQCHSCKEEIRTHLPFEKPTSGRSNRARQRLEPPQAKEGTTEMSADVAQVDGARKRRRKE